LEDLRYLALALEMLDALGIDPGRRRRHGSPTAGGVTCPSVLTGLVLALSAEVWLAWLLAWELRGFRGVW
jgi:hypothetical protein